MRKNKQLSNQIEFKKAKANFKRVLARAKDAYWNKFCSGLDRQTKLKKVWNIVNTLKGKSSNGRIVIKNDQGTFFEESELPDKFADNFSSISNRISHQPDVLNIRNNTVHAFLKANNNFCKQLHVSPYEEDVKIINEPFKSCELSNILKNLNAKSSPGHDEISYLFFKHSPANVINYCLNIINKSWITNYIPDSWKLAIIKPVLKPSKNRGDITSYRPISLTTTICKIFEKMIVARLTWYLEKNNLLNANQAGFRKNCSTCDPIVRLQHEAKLAVDSGNITVAVMIDFSKAFDLLWIDGLLLKMLKLNITGNMYNWIKNFLSRRKCMVKVGNSYSYEYITENGTPQGSSLSPILFLIMVNDFPQLSQFTSDAFFADDCNLWRSGKNIQQITFHLQKDLDIISKWCSDWGFYINLEKTTGIIFTNKHIDPNSIILTIQNKRIKFQNTCKMLGIFLDKGLTWKPHIDYLADKSKKSLNIMRCVSGTKWGANKHTLLILHKTLILSSLDYCGFIYSDISITNSKILDSIQYKSLLLVTGGMRGTSMNALLGECGELPLKYRREKLQINYLLKICGNKRNAASETLNDKKFFQMDINYKSNYAVILDRFLKDNNINHLDKDYYHVSLPNLDLDNTVDLTFPNKSNEFKTYDPNLYSALLNDTVENSLKIHENIFFIDGSVNNSGEVGAAIFSPTIPVHYQFRLPNHFSVYYSEGYPIYKTIEYIVEHNLTNSIIFSDNFKVLTDIKYSGYDLSPHPQLIYGIVTLLSIYSHLTITLKWLPGHVSNHFHSTIDSLAKSASSSSTIEQVIYTAHEAKLLIEDWIWRKWLQDWSNKPSSRYQNCYRPRRDCFVIKKSRRQEITVCRLRMLQSNLRGDQFKINMHVDGLCDICRKNEDCFHLIMDCQKTDQMRLAIKANSPHLRNNWTYQNILSDETAINIIIDYLQKNNIDI